MVDIVLIFDLILSLYRGPIQKLMCSNSNVIVENANNSHNFNVAHMILMPYEYEGFSPANEVVLMHVKIGNWKLLTGI